MPRRGTVQIMPFVYHAQTCLEVLDKGSNWWSLRNGWMLEDGRELGTKTGIDGKLDVSKKHAIFHHQQATAAAAAGWFVEDVSSRGTLICVGARDLNVEVQPPTRLQPQRLFAAGKLIWKITALAAAEGGGDGAEPGKGVTLQIKATNKKGDKLISESSLAWVDGKTYTLGSDDANDVRVDAATAKEYGIGGVHCNLRCELGDDGAEQAFTLQDAGSATGTWVGLKKKTPLELNIGDCLLCGAMRVRMIKKKLSFDFDRGFLDLILGKKHSAPKEHGFTVTGETPVIERLKRMK